MYGQPNYQQFLPNGMGQMPQFPPFGGPAPMSITKVTGIEGARAYMVAPNSSVALFDDSRDVFYLKTTDAGGYPTIRVFQAGAWARCTSRTWVMRPWVLALRSRETMARGSICRTALGCTLCLCSRK